MTTRPSLVIFPASYLALARFSISLRYSWKTSRLSWPEPCQGFHGRSPEALSVKALCETKQRMEVLPFHMPK